ncbi:cyclophilin-type peptidyl-prolyl cis-trans isomerase, partial [Kipferlia bialata]
LAEPGTPSYTRLQENITHTYKGKVLGGALEFRAEWGEKQTESEAATKKREARSNAVILEMLGDLPDIEAAPEDNVIFVCKLNRITTSEDLELIFSRFGKVLCCEVIRDRDTDDSLGYAFVEYSTVTACERCYAKMDGVVIDDRRIHVDFSQSVSHTWKKHKAGMSSRSTSGSGSRSTGGEGQPRVRLRDRARDEPEAKRRGD